MNFWHKFPFVRLLLPFIIGIVFAISTGMPYPVPMYLIFGLVVAFVVFEFAFSKNILYKHRWFMGLYINILLLLSGYQLTYLHTPQFSPHNISRFVENPGEYVFRVSEAVSEKPGSVKVVARVNRIKDSLSWKPVDGTVMLYFQKDSLSIDLKYGDVFVAQLNLQEIKVPQNPGEFNYKRYLGFKGISHQAYIKSGSWKLIDENKGYPLFALGIKTRKHFLHILESNGIKGKEFAVASAVLLGYGDKLDTDQRREFSGAGAMHILCVSGLHVGIIYFVMNSLLAFLNKNRMLQILKLVLLLLSLWLYALITGFSPSVLRASTMFSFIVLGRSFGRRTHIYNLLAASAFVLLAFDPYILTAVGFQLSYLAVAGIVTFFKPIYNLVIPDNWLLNQIWQITVVSFSATISTLPLSLYYFHRFPNLFLVTNLVAIPVSMIIIYVGLAVLISSPIPFISGFLAKALAGVIWFLNTTVHWIEGLKFSTTDGIFISFPEMLALFGITISFGFMTFQYRKRPIFSIFIFALVFLISISVRKGGHLVQSKFIVYNVNKSTAIDFINGKESIFISDSLLLNDDGKQSYHIFNNRYKSGITRTDNYNIETNTIKTGVLQKAKDFILFRDRVMLLLAPGFQYEIPGQKIKLDFLIVRRNRNLDFDKLIASFTFDTIIFDSSNSEWKVKKWEKECMARGIKYYNVKKQGAFVLEM